MLDRRSARTMPDILWDKEMIGNKATSVDKEARNSGKQERTIDTTEESREGENLSRAPR